MYGDASTWQRKRIRIGSWERYQRRPRSYLPSK